MSRRSGRAVRLLAASTLGQRAHSLTDAGTTAARFYNLGTWRSSTTKTRTAFEPSNAMRARPWSPRSWIKFARKHITNSSILSSGYPEKRTQQPLPVDITPSEGLVNRVWFVFGISLTVALPCRGTCSDVRGRNRLRTWLPVVSASFCLRVCSASLGSHLA